MPTDEDRGDSLPSLKLKSKNGKEKKQRENYAKDSNEIPRRKTRMYLDGSVFLLLHARQKGKPVIK